MRSVKLSTLLCIDLECTCWAGHPPEGEQSDIIEVGICELNLQTLKIERSEGILIKPSRSSISHFCESLTTISEETLKGAKDFTSAMNYIRNKYSPYKKLWTSWGRFDQTRLERECREKEVRNPFGPEYFNTKSLYSAIHGFPRGKGQTKALKNLGLSQEGVQHRGVDDAYNLAKIVRHLFSYHREY